MTKSSKLSSGLGRLPMKSIFFLATAVLAAQAANAASQASSTKLVLSYTLTDLAPDDHIDPTYIVDAEWTSVRVDNTEVGDAKRVYNSIYGPGNYVSPISATSNSTAFAVAASVSREPSVDGKVILEASTFLHDNGGLQGQTAIAWGTYEGRYYLSPNTKITYTLDYEFTQDSPWVNRETGASLSAHLPGVIEGIGSTEGTKTGRITASYINDGSTDKRIFISFDAIAFVTAVPEPTTYGMMLAGLGIVGFTIRRRKAM